MDNLVSIITPSYNCSDFISETIDSVLNQTYTNWEMIIVDDLSTDNSVDIIQNYCDKDERIKLIKLEENSGAAVARNKAIESSKGKYIAFLDSDDLWKPEKLVIQINYMEENNISLSYSSYELINETSEKLNKTINPPNSLTYKALLKENQIGCLTAVYNQKEIGKFYMPLIRKRQDYGLWLKILKKVDNAYKVPGNLALYRIRENSISSNKINLLKFNYELFNKHEGLSKIESLYYLGLNILRKLIK